MADLIKEAVREVNNLKAYAIENAKNVLAEQMSDQLKAAVSKAINERLDESEKNTPSNYDSAGETKRKDKSPGNDPADMGDGPDILEASVEDEEEVVVDDEEEMDEAEDFEDIDMEEAEDLDLGDDVDMEEAENIEVIDDTEMEEAADVDNLEDLDMEEARKSVVDDEEEMAEASCEDGEEVPQPKKSKKAPPVEESRLVRQLKSNNAKLRNENSRLSRALRVLKETVNEVNLFNARLTGTQKISSKFGLNRKAVKAVASRFDECKSVSEVKRMYKVMYESMSYKNRSRKRVTLENKNVVRRGNKTTMTEGTNYTRMQQLAGVI